MKVKCVQMLPSCTWTQCDEGMGLQGSTEEHHASYAIMHLWKKTIYVATWLNQHSMRTYKVVDNHLHNRMVVTVCSTPNT